jgi:tRNA pseudouridine55 synthase
MPDGIIIIDKPAGLTSHDVVARLRRILKTKKIGHTGTLDPFATGVLVMLVGKATRLARFLHADEKEYEAVARFGFETDTGDITGERRGGSFDGLQSLDQITLDSIAGILSEFKGEIEQIPPMYSAKKVDGKRLYKLAREGVEIEREPVKVVIRELEITAECGDTAETKDIAFRVVCSAGTYIRTLAEDIGRKIGVGCHLIELRRTRAGRFGIEKAVTLEDLEEAFVGGEGYSLLPLSEAVNHLISVTLTSPDLDRTSRGMSVANELTAAADGGSIAMLTEDGTLAAVGEYDAAENVIKPKLVMV